MVLVLMLELVRLSYKDTWDVKDHGHFRLGMIQEGLYRKNL